MPYKKETKIKEKTSVILRKEVLSCACLPRYGGIPGDLLIDSGC